MKCLYMWLTCIRRQVMRMDILLRLQLGSAADYDVIIACRILMMTNMTAV